MATFRTLLFTLAAATAMTGQAAAADPSSTKPYNAFSGPLEVREGIKFSADNEDVGNPFTEAHPTESYRYSAFYERYYGIQSPIGDPLLKQLPGSTDRDGHPLWYDGPSGADSLGYIVVRLLGEKKFSDLDRLYRDWSDPKEVFADGRPKILAFWLALSNVYSNLTDWEKSYDLIKEWRGANPLSAAGAIAEAGYWASYAWNARGNTYANEVTEDGWALYKERLMKEKAVLEESADYAKGIAWFRLSMDLERDLNFPKEQRLALLGESLKSEPDTYILYVGLVENEQARWGGSWQEVDRIIRLRLDQ